MPKKIKQCWITLEFGKPYQETEETSYQVSFRWKFKLKSVQGQMTLE